MGGGATKRYAEGGNYTVLVSLFPFTAFDIFSQQTISDKTTL